LILHIAWIQEITMKNGYCSTCQTMQTAGEAVAGKIIGATTGAALGAAAPLPEKAVTIVGGILFGLVVGEIVDQLVVPKCSQCGTVLQILAEVM
jgi:hypothetical protein